MHQDVDVVLVSLGTPEELSSKAIRGFLRRFLSDKRVVEAPRLVWLPVLYAFILPFRTQKLKHAYEQIWQRGCGSPLRLIAQQQVVALQAAVRTHVALSGVKIDIHGVMMYDKENVEQFIKKRISLQRKLIIIPLYPQYSATTTAAVYDQVFAAYQSLRHISSHFIINHYYQHPLYRKALSESVQEFWQEHGRSDYLLMSFHGIPQQYVDLGDPYFTQCATTAKNLTTDLLLNETQTSYSFQSRLGPKQWLQPYTTHELKRLAQCGVKIVDVVCPAFSADCLETLEEIAIQARTLFIEAGGEQLRLIPSLNCNAQHIELFVQLILESLAL